MDNQTMVHLHHGIPLSNKKEQITHTRNNLDESQRYYVKEATLTSLHRLWFHLYDILKKTKLYNRDISDSQGLGKVGLERGACSEGMELFCILIAVVATWTYMCQHS